MRCFEFGHFTDLGLLDDLSHAIARDREKLAEILALIAEADSRKAYLPAGYSSMHAYCMGQLHYTEDAAKKRIHAARVARRLPALFHALADGKLHLSGVRVLAPYLTEANVHELIADATYRSRAEIEHFLSRRFGSFQELHIPSHQPAPGPVDPPAPRDERAPGPVDDPSSSGQVTPAPEPAMTNQEASASGASRVRPFRLDIDEAKLEYARALLSHSLPRGNPSQVVDRALDALIGQLEKRKFGATEKPHLAPAKVSSRKRYIPAHIRRAVWKRDQGRCTFTGHTGHRCSERKLLEYDHAKPVACGGKATVEGLRLRCRGHNQLEAERAFGKEFMRRKREEVRGVRDAQKESCSSRIERMVLASS